jgi:hypothetical protein
MKRNSGFPNQTYWQISEWITLRWIFLLFVKTSQNIGLVISHELGQNRSDVLLGCQ